MQIADSDSDHPRLCQINLAEKYGGDDLFQTNSCALFCVDLLSIYLLVHPSSLGQPDQGCLQDVARLPDMLDEYGLAGRLSLIPLETEFVLAGSGTVFACEMEEPSAHGLAFKLVQKVVTWLRHAPDDSARVSAIWSLDRQELLGLRAKLVREWTVATHARQERSGPLPANIPSHEEPPAPSGKGVPEKTSPIPRTGKGKGGRPRSRDDLWEFVKKMKMGKSKSTDADIANAYNKHFARSIKERKRSRADAKAVRDARYDRTSRERKHGDGTAQRNTDR